MFIFPIIFIISFFVALREILSGNKAGFLFFLIFGLSVYTTAMSVTYLLGLKSIIPILQSSKEVLVIILLITGVVTLKTKPKLHLIDYLVLSFLALTVIYAILPLGPLSFTGRLVALKSISFYMVVYIAGRLIDIRSVFISKYFNYILILTVAVGAVVITERVFYQNLQNYTGYAEYVYNVYNIEPSGDYGLRISFQSEGGYKRFASVFDSPLEFADATLIALAVMLALFTSDDNKFRPTRLGWVALIASFVSITFAFSRMPFASYFFIIYIYAIITKKRRIIKVVNYGLIAGACYIAYLFIDLTVKRSGIMEVLLNTIDFSNPSSVGHLLAWAEGIAAIVAHPFGLGIGASGRAGGSSDADIVGGENQFIIIAVQAGVAAMLLYLSAYIFLIKEGLKWFKIFKGNERKLCLAVLLFKIGIFVALFTSEVEGSSYISYLGWFLSGLFVASIMQYKPESQSI